jgi:hypothetical protein
MVIAADKTYRLLTVQSLIDERKLMGSKVLRPSISADQIGNSSIGDKVHGLADDNASFHRAAIS